MITALLIALPSIGVSAQQSSVSLLPGAEVRVTLSDGPRVAGTVTFASRDSVVVASSSRDRSTIPTTNIRRIEQFAGHSHVAGAVRGATIMGIVGAMVIGGGKPPSRDEACPSGSRPSCRPVTRLEMAVSGAIVFGWMGEWIGGIVGRDRWRRVNLPEPRAIAAMQAAQTRLPALAPGLRIRVDAPGVLTDGFEATVIQVSADSLTLATTKGIRFDVPKSAIANVRRAVRSRSAGAGAGALWGAAVYAPISPVAAFDANGASAIGAMVYFTAVGSGVGAAVGALKGKETWEVVRP